MTGTAATNGSTVEIEVDAALTITGWDARAAAAFGVDAAAAIGRKVAEVVPVAGGAAAWQQVLAADEATQVWPLADGTRVFEWWPRRRLGADGAVVGATCHGRDVTERAAAERQSALDRQMLAAIYDNLQIAAWAIDARGTFLVQEGRATLPAPRALLGMNLFELFGQNPAMADIRRGVAGEPSHTLTEEVGRDWESWTVPQTAAGPDDVALIGISLDITETKRGEKELRDKLEVIERQREVIRAMATPIIEVWDGILTLPILGLVDSVRTAEIMDSLLQAIVRVRARYAILDMTGVEVVDTATAGHLIALTRAIELLGARGIITGIHPNIAQTMVSLGVDLSRISVHANLREALKHCIGRMTAR
jgi:rsbT co-antagonist protein RsbR